MLVGTRIVKRLLLLSGLLASLPLCAHAQKDTLAFETLPLNQGAPTVISRILQDKAGFMWFATFDGLYRYDGYDLVSYMHEPGDTSSLADNKIHALFEDKAGVLWVGGPRGLDRFEPTSGTFRHYTPGSSGAEGDAINIVWYLAEGRDGALWVNTGKGIYRFDRAAEEFSFLQVDTSDPGTVPVSTIYEDKQGGLWFGSARGLHKFEFESGKFRQCWGDPRYDYEKWYVEGSRHWINAILQDERGVLWLATSRGLVEYDPGTEMFSTPMVPATDHPGSQPSDSSISCVCQDVLSGELWVGTGAGLYSFNRGSRKFSRRTNEGPASAFSDRSGTLWLGTLTAVRKVNRTTRPFRKYSIGDIGCAFVPGANGALWIYGLKSGWLKFDLAKERLVPYAFGGDNLYYVYREGDLALLKKDGSFYIQDTLGKVAFALGPESKAFNTSLSFGWKTSRGYYVGSHKGGLYLFDPRAWRAKEVRNLGQSIYNIYEDSLSFLWVATTAGRLFRYDQAKDNMEEIALDPRSSEGRSSQLVNQIHEDKKGRLWLATSLGLERYDRSTNTFLRLTEHDGLPGNNVRGVSEDDHGFLWLNTNKGISKFNPDLGRFRNFDVSHGLELASDVYYGWAFRAGNGEMVFGGANGFTRFHPDSVKENRFIPPIVLTSFRIFDKPCPLPPEIRLPHNENFISFTFAALSFVSPERNQYAYMMEGVDKEWVYSGTRRYASYPNLAPGNYLFRVKGSNNEGLWNETGTSIAIVISPPWWKTTWAYLFYGVVLIGLAYYTWSLQVRRLGKKHEYEMTRFEAAKLHEVDAMKSRFFANISHEFRTPLTLILGPVGEVMEEADKEETRHKLNVVQKNARRLLALVNQLLDLSKLESGNMKLQAVCLDVVSLVKGLSQSFSSYAERKRISLNVCSDQPSVIAYIDKDKFEKILTNILSNAFKFTPEGGLIEISVTRDEAHVTVRINDTGIGIPADKLGRIFDRFYQVDDTHTRAQEGTGIGLSLTKELVDLHRGTIEIASQEGKGTTVSLRFPLGTKHLRPEEICSRVEGQEGLWQPAVKVAPSDDVDEAKLPEEVDQPKPPYELVSEPGETVVLVVEDNADVRDYVRRNLIDSYRVREAADGEEGWKESLEEMPDVIVSDVMMPNMDGFELCRRLKADERTSHIPVILLTAKAGSHDRIEGFDIGADDYIMKPFEPEEVKARIRNLIEQRKRIHEHFRKHGLLEIEEKQITPVDQRFLQNALAVITSHISDPAFGVELMAAEMAVSRSLLLKKCEALTGEPPSELIKRTRLSRAARLIEGKFGNVTEIALEVGFNNPSYFTECFRKQFGCPPSHYRSDTDIRKA